MKSLLTSEDVAASVAWRALERLYGGNVLVWEPETIRLSLARDGIEPRDGLMAKLLGAQTVLVADVVYHDHDVLFAFALALDEVPADAGMLHHPTPEQLCWAVDEVAALRGERADDDAGFDADFVDAAIAVVLHDEGYLRPPDALAFCAHALTPMTHATADERGELDRVWARLRDKDDATFERVAPKLPPWLLVQVARLRDCAAYVAERVAIRDRHTAELGPTPP